MDFPSKAWQGEELQGGLPYKPVVDVDARFRVESDLQGRVLRGVKVDVPARDHRGRPTGEILGGWYVTNLPRDKFSAELRVMRMRCGISSEIVLATVLEWWNEIVIWLRRSDGFEQIRWISFRNVLVYDSRHRYRTRPRRTEQLLHEIERRAQERRAAA